MAWQTAIFSDQAVQEVIFSIFVRWGDFLQELALWLDSLKFSRPCWCCVDFGGFSCL